MTYDCDSFVAFSKECGDALAEDILTRVCEAHWSVDHKRYGVEFRDIHQHDACNHTLSGTIDVGGVEYGFIIDNGNWAGTVVREWGLADDVGTYDPPKPIIYTLVPKNPLLRFDAPGLWSVYLAWRGEKWFEEIVRGYNYDRHFAPGGKTEGYWKAKADQRGLKIAPTEDYEALLIAKPPIPKAEFEKLVAALSEPLP